MSSWGELLGEAIFYRLRAVVDSSRDAPSMTFVLEEALCRGKAILEYSLPTMRSRPGLVGMREYKNVSIINKFLDSHSSVDMMKSVGLDSSREGRLRYAAENGITGVPFSAGWGDDILKHLQNTHGG